ncbi:hypothetical protein J1N35_023451 [Gossypium stocksii]|uniref:Serine/threonine-protein phosphatase 7 long form-like protein n=1 Tax=Gossypium stocksii TaxID=47602 RepID=A0A9D3VI50_9ROSI|nr:hypothetical protein J1N35_023451 [Gossypium stocksii]
MLYRELCWTTKPDAIDIGRCLILLQSWALYQMSLLALVRHQACVFPLVNRQSTNPSIRRSYTVPIYHLMIEQHAREGISYSNIRDISFGYCIRNQKLRLLYPRLPTSFTTVVH